MESSEAFYLSARLESRRCRRTSWSDWDRCRQVLKNTGPICDTFVPLVEDIGVTLACIEEDVVEAALALEEEDEDAELGG